ncbi:MAG: 2-isopropylmalate synthase, partial [Desulfobacterales bacterium]|nr:2-isopropylmalate synthase [Desulfobacterales bacterium]
MSEDNRIIVFDTTLRDGEQSPGASMNQAEKLRIATQLEALGVDVIEAGFPAASDGDFEAVKAIAETLKTAQIAALCRANENDIRRGWEAIKDAAHPRIHTFIATSELHMKYKLQMEPERVLEKAVESVKLAASFTDNVEFSAEDGSRSDRDFLCKIFEAVIDAGATTINLPDTVGYAVPE